MESVKCKYHRWRPDNLHHQEIVARLISPDFINRYAHILMKPLIKFESHVNYFCLNQEMETFNFNIYSLGHLAQSRDTSWHYERYIIIIPICCLLVSKIWYHPEMRKLSQSTTDILKHFLITTLYPGHLRFNPSVSDVFNNLSYVLVTFCPFRPIGCDFGHISYDTIFHGAPKQMRQWLCLDVCWRESMVYVNMRYERAGRRG